jgi:hypothetical protein
MKYLKIMKIKWKIISVYGYLIDDHNALSKKTTIKFVKKSKLNAKEKLWIIFMKVLLMKLQSEFELVVSLDYQMVSFLNIYYV